VLAYSINIARKRILEKRIGWLELSQYVFSRQCYFLLKQDKPAMCAEKGLGNISSLCSTLVLTV
jgi:hypothetical protein